VLRADDKSVVSVATSIQDVAAPVLHRSEEHERFVGDVEAFLGLFDRRFDYRAAHQMDRRCCVSEVGHRGARAQELELAVVAATQNRVRARLQFGEKVEVMAQLIEIECCLVDGDGCQREGLAAFVLTEPRLACIGSTRGARPARLRRTNGVTVISRWRARTISCGRSMSEKW